MKFFKKLVPAIGALIFFAACQSRQMQTSGPVRVRIPIDDGTGTYRLQTVSFHSAVDIKTMRTQSAIIRSEGKILSTPANEYQENISVDQGRMASGDFITDSDGVLIAANTDTLIMVTMLYHMEKIKDLFDQVGANEGLSFPLTLLFNSNLVVKRGNHTEVQTDNATYYNDLDIINVRTYKSNLIPAGMNGGILGHEYFHRVFYKEQKQFRKELNESQRDKVKANMTLFAAMNEGLADYFGYRYSNNPDYGSPTFSQAKFRDLRNDDKMTMGSTEMNSWFVQSATYGSESGPNINGLGSYFARFLHRAEGVLPKQDLDQEVINFTKAYVKSHWQNVDSKFLDYNDFVKIFVSSPKFSKETRRQLLKTAKDIFPKQVTE